MGIIPVIAHTHTLSTNKQMKLMKTTSDNNHITRKE